MTGVTLLIVREVARRESGCEDGVYKALAELPGETGRS